MNTSKAVRRLLPTILMSALLPVTLPPASGAEVKVILLGGQSNAVGQALSSGLPTNPVNLQLPQADVLFFYDGNASLTTLRPGSGGKPWPNAAYFGPEISFGHAIADASPSVTYAIIKHGENGTALYNDWDPATGPSYSRFRDTVSDGMAAMQAAGHTTEIVGMVWHQGESDAIENQQAPYESNLSAFMADIRTRYGANLPFLIGEIRRSNGPAFVTVADAQIAVAAADPFASFVPASDLTFSDTYHFNAASLVTLGERFATAYANLARDPVITGVSIADVSSEFNLTTRLATNVIDGTGFTEAQGYHTNTDFGLWNNVGIGLAATTGDDPFPVTITFDLGESHDLDSLKIWNWNAANTLTAGAKDIEILVAAQGGGTFTSLGSFTLTQAPGLANVDFGQLIDLSGFPATADARLIRINIISNHGFAYELAGFSEIRFSGVPSAGTTDFSAFISDPVFALDPTDREFTLDPDHDQIPNGLEAWFGTHPGEFSAGLSEITTDGTVSTFSHPLNPDMPGDLGAYYQWSPNLVDWYDGDGIDGPPSGNTVVIISNSIESTTTITATGSEAFGNLFFRVGVKQQP